MTAHPRIVYAERLGQGVVIEFDDGKTALYPATLLHEIFLQAQDLTDSENTQDQA